MVGGPLDHSHPSTACIPIGKATGRDRSQIRVLAGNKSLFKQLLAANTFGELQCTTYILRLFVLRVKRLACALYAARHRILCL